ncbi:MAG: calcium-binding protein [Planctomycetota bacterium]
MSFKVGNSVKVKEGIMCPDDDSVCISGWQGRVFEIEEDDNIVGIRWDSITLKQLPLEYIKRSEEEGLDWSEMYLSVDEIELASPRDSQAQAEDMAEKMEGKFQWIGENEEDKRISKVIADAEDELEAWNSYLRGVLKFPFEATVSEHQEKGQLKHGDIVRVQGIVEADDLYGILVDVKYGRQNFVFPLCDLAVRDKKSANYTPVQDYCVWFANM